MVQADMRGKACLVTGGNSGLGKATAIRLAQLQATVILGCRGKQRGEATLAEIKSSKRVKSRLMREAPFPVRWITSLLSSKPEQAVQSVVYYASAPEVEGKTGMFFKGRQAIEIGDDTALFGERGKKKF